MSDPGYRLLRERLETLETSEEIKQLFRNLIDETAVLKDPEEQDNSDRVKFARHLLDLKEPRSVIKNRLIARFGVGKSTAYRDITAALAIVPKVPSEWDKDRV